MIEEDYVSFETAKLLKEKGFDKDWVDGSIEKYLNGTEGYSLPTLAIAMKWLREVHKIFICIIPSEVGPGVMDYTYILYKVDTENFIFKDLGIQGRANTDKMSAPKTCEEAIKYCLENLI